MAIIPVLKSNAYGHGLAALATILRTAPVDLLAVDGYFEAASLQAAGKRILVLGYIAPQNARLLDTRCCSFVVQDVPMLAALGQLGRTVRVHLELNTGMNRLGLSARELPPYLKALQRHPTLELEGVMSHLADADNPADDTMTREQVQLFDAGVRRVLQAGFRPRLIHLAQTAGSTRPQSRYANALRLGIGLYGINPLALDDPRAQQLEDLQPVLALTSTIIKVIALRPGDAVGYNRTFVAKRPLRLGVLPLGYYEGVPRALSNAGVVTAGRHAFPIVGGVSMNHTMIDLGNSGLGVGDEITVISRDPASPNSVACLAGEHGLFPYGLLTGIAPTIRRVVV